MANDSQITQEPTVLNGINVTELKGKKEVDMRRRLTCLVLLSAAIVVTALYHAKKVLATPADGFVGTTLAVGRFGKIDVFNHSMLTNSSLTRHKKDIWLSWQKTKGSSDLYLQNNVWQP